MNDMTYLKIYNILLDIEEANGNFFQNYYVYSNSESGAVDCLIVYISKYDYLNVSIDNVETVTDVVDIENLVYDEELPGYIQQVEYRY